VSTPAAPSRGRPRKSPAALRLACGVALAAWPLISARADIPIRYADVARTGDMICELNASGSRRAGETAPSGRRGSDLLMIFDGLGTGSGIGRVVSSRSVGAREVRMYSSETGLHLVEDVNGSVVVTSLLGCEAHEGSSNRCIRYTAVNAWHFDQTVHRDPDSAFRRLPGTSYSGHCEAWYMNQRPRNERGEGRVPSLSP
jgi:hypothetical protein